MNSRILMLRNCYASILTKRIPKNTYSTKPAHCDAHMNELPVPCGPWDVYYKERQSYYTKWLVFGAGWWLFSFFMMLYTDSLYLNWGPPALPGPSSDADSGADDGC